MSDDRRHEESSENGRERPRSRYFFGRRFPIPREFHSFLRRAPFDTCLMCDRVLLADGVEYVIEKAVRAEEVIFEYAVCGACARAIDDELSTESIHRIIRHYEEQGMNLVKRLLDLHDQPWDSIDAWIDRCVVTGAPREDCTEYQLYAECNGTDLVVSVAPVMISGRANEHVWELLSPKTKGWVDRFIDEYLGLPPELKDWAKERPLLVP